MAALPPTKIHAPVDASMHDSMASNTPMGAGGYYQADDDQYSQAGAQMVVIPTASAPHRVEKYPHRQRKQGAEITNLFKKPQEIFASAVNLAEYKSAMRFDKIAVLGFLAGAYIALAGCICIMFGGGVPTIKHDDPGLQKFLFACIFPFGIILCVICGAELVTSNMAVLPAGLLAGRITVWQMLNAWCWAYLGNFAGSLFVAGAMIYGSALAVDDPWGSFVRALIEKKALQATWSQQVLRGIGCNWLVCLGFWSSLAAEDIIGKIWALWFPICAFVVIGFEHCVMNMFLLPAGMMYGANVSVGEFLGYNLVPVTIGNIFGGLLVAVPYWYVYWLPSHPISLEAFGGDAEKPSKLAACFGRGKKAAPESTDVEKATAAGTAGGVDALVKPAAAGGAVGGTSTPLPTSSSKIAVAYGYARPANGGVAAPLTPVAWVVPATTATSGTVGGSRRGSGAPGAADRPADAPANSMVITVTGGAPGTPLAGAPGTPMAVYPVTAGSSTSAGSRAHPPSSLRQVATSEAACGGATAIPSDVHPEPHPHPRANPALARIRAQMAGGPA